MSALRPAGFFWLLCWAGLAPLAARAESPLERFDRGRLEFEHKNFGNAITILRGVLYPAVQLTREEDLVAARELLGLAYFYVGEEQKARDEFTLLLYLRPGHRLDSFLIPPQAVAFFDKLAHEPQLQERLQQIERERQERELREAQQKQKTPTMVRRIYLERSEIHRSRLIAFLPLGIGQFQNGQTLKGILLAAGGGVALTTNIVSYALLYSLRKQTQVGGVTHVYYSDVDLAKGLRVTQYVALGVFAASWIYGIIDANLAFTPVETSPYRQSREEQEIERAPVAPGAVKDGVGLLFQGSF
jgi:hypothetical protein